MEVQVWFRDGHVETHRIPERVGRSRSVIDETGGIEYSLSDVDEVADIVDRFYPTPEGWVLDRLVVGGRGLQKEADLGMIRELAALLGGDWAVTRPLVEKGWATNARQIGLSGRTVRPKLIITCGVSGAIQFTSCMNASDHIVSINTDRDAPIFGVAHVSVVGDLYEIVPEMIAQLRRDAHEQL